jgi:hypothetical protein
MPFHNKYLHCIYNLILRECFFLLRLRHTKNVRMNSVCIETRNNIKSVVSMYKTFPFGYVYKLSSYMRFLYLTPLYVFIHL